MEKSGNSRRQFIRTATIAGIGLGFGGALNRVFAQTPVSVGRRIGIIGLDTSHSVEFTKMFNSPDADPALKGFRVTAVYPQGSRDIKSSLDMVPGYLKEIKGMGIEIVDSISALLERTDVILLESNDGRVHLEQAMPVLKAGKPMFIDKPVAASLADTEVIFKTARQYKVPVFSSSALRYMDSVQQVLKGKIGKVTGADVYTPAFLEKTHPDLFWYAIHGVEVLFAVMGTGCRKVTRISGPDIDVVTGVWEDGRIGVLRAVKKGPYGFGGHVFGEKAIAPISDFDSYKPLVYEIATFFDTGIVPVKPEETLEIIAFMEAADASKRKNGATVKMGNTIF